MTAPACSLEYPDDVLTDGLDDLRVVRMALMSEWFDINEILSIATVLSRGIKTVERVKAVLDEGALSEADGRVPADKLLISRFVPREAVQ